MQPDFAMQTLRARAGHPVAAASTAAEALLHELICLMVAVCLRLCVRQPLKVDNALLQLSDNGAGAFTATVGSGLERPFTI